MLLLNKIVVIALVEVPGEDCYDGQQREAEGDCQNKDCECYFHITPSACLSIFETIRITLLRVFSICARLPFGSSKQRAATRWQYLITAALFLRLLIASHF